MENNTEYTSVQGQAKKGLNTFVLTLSISLIVFSTIYYFMTSNSVEDESFTDSSDKVTVVQEPVMNDNPASSETVFGSLAQADPGATSRQVLAETDEAIDTTTTTTTVTETTQSNSNLDTGVTSITIGLFAAFTLFISAVIFVYKNPRKMALSGFEKKTTKGL